LPFPIESESSRGSRGINRVIALLALSLLINYIDRGSLSIAAPMLKDELGLSYAQLGLLLGSFFWTYASFLLVSGWLVDRCNANWLLAIGFMLWSGATAVTGALHTFAALLAARLLLGIGESVAYPSYSKILVQHVPEVRRGFANAVIAAGLGCGPALGTFLGAMLMARYGWRSFFVALGMISMAWLVPWFAWMPRGEAAATETAASEKGKSGPRFIEILKQRSLWGTCGGLFGANYSLYFEITWLPFYLERERHFSKITMGKIGGTGYLCFAAGAVLFGWISDRWIAAGQSPSVVRKTFTGVGVGGAGVLLLGCALAGPRVSVVLLLLAFLCGGMSASNIWAMTQTIAGPKTAGRWTGFQNFMGNLAGIIAPTLTGLAISQTGQFLPSFLLMAAVALGGCLCFVCLVGPVKEIAWEG